MIPVIARIIARYVSGAMMTIGFLPPEIAAQFGTDPDVVLAIGAGISALVEGAYAFAKRKGWAT